MASSAERAAERYEFPCTECKGDAYIGYGSNKEGTWGGMVKAGERLCTRCFQKRGGKPFFGLAHAEGK